MAHLKRHKAPKRWPIHRKGTTFVVRANFNPKKGVPILIVLRDMLKIANNRKEVKKALHAKNILLNNKTVINDKNTALLFDVITILPKKKYYRIVLSETGRFNLDETIESEANRKVSKIINKKILKGKKPQLNLIDGMNFLSEIKCDTNDSVLINLKNRKIEKCLPLKEKANVIIFEGNHAGKKGIIKKINNELKMAELNINKEKTINILIKQLMVVE